MGGALRVSAADRDRDALVAIDLHAGDLIEDLTPFVIYRETGEASLDERIRKMANASVTLGGEECADGGAPRILYALAALNGVASMLAESGRRFS